jgi:hypothetical protein
LRSPIFRMALIGRRAFACLAALSDPAPAAEHPLFAEAIDTARIVSKLRVSIAPSMVQLVLSAIRALQRHDDVALEHARAAQSGLTHNSFLHAARYLEGLLVGGSDGRAKRDAVLAWLEAEGCVAPQRYLRQLVPGLDLLEARA